MINLIKNNVSGLKKKKKKKNVLQNIIVCP
jgi:hypothetical protein